MDDSATSEGNIKIAAELVHEPHVDGNQLRVVKLSNDAGLYQRLPKEFAS